MQCNWSESHLNVDAFISHSTFAAPRDSAINFYKKFEIMTEVEDNLKLLLLGHHGVNQEIATEDMVFKMMLGM